MSFFCFSVELSRVLTHRQSLRVEAVKKVKKLTSSEARKAKKERMARKKLGLASEGEEDF